MRRGPDYRVRRPKYGQGELCRATGLQSEPAEQPSKSRQNAGSSQLGSKRRACNRGHFPYNAEYERPPKREVIEERTDAKK